MIDTIRGHFNIEDTSSLIDKMDGSFSGTVKKEDMVRGKHESKHYVFKGKYKNMSITINGSYVSFFGSLSKFYFGNNMQQLNTNETRDAISQLSEVFHTSPNDIQLTRIDVALNLIMNDPPERYFTFLLNTPRMVKDIYNNGRTVLYKNGLWAIEFYNKTLEMNDKKKEIPPEYKNLNVLRFEVRFTKRLSDRFRRKVTLDMLSINDFRKDLIDTMIKSYKSVNKEQNYIGGYDTNSMSKLKNSIIKQHLNTASNSNTLLLEIDSNPKLTKKNRSVKYKMKDFLRKSTQKSKGLVPVPLIEELNKKIEKQVEILRRESI